MLFRCIVLIPSTKRDVLLRSPEVISLLKKLQHENLSRTYAVHFAEDVRAFFVEMDLIAVPASSLQDEMMRTKKENSEQRVRKIANGVLRAVAYLHSAKMAHLHIDLTSVGARPDSSAVLDPIGSVSFDFPSHALLKSYSERSEAISCGRSISTTEPDNIGERSAVLLRKLFTEHEIQLQQQTSGQTPETIPDEQRCHHQDIWCVGMLILNLLLNRNICELSATTLSEIAAGRIPSRLQISKHGQNFLSAAFGSPESGRRFTAADLLSHPWFVGEPRTRLSRRSSPAPASEQTDSVVRRIGAALRIFGSGRRLNSSRSPRAKSFARSTDKKLTLTPEDVDSSIAATSVLLPRPS
mmetsp:Transcript_11687/g.31478  ORF Transcript_11687/g.31478 Transcript_11687/m.31478 type:complete len:354 (+) Transcript_11687:2-1063(+)